MGWTIKEMKLRGKKAFDNNYWKAVAIAFIMALVAGGVSGFNGGGSSRMSSLFESNHSNYSNSSTDTGSGLIGEVEEDEEKSDSEEKTELVIDTQSPETFKESMNNMSTTDKVVLGGVHLPCLLMFFYITHWKWAAVVSSSEIWKSRRRYQTLFMHLIRIIKMLSKFFSLEIYI